MADFYNLLLLDPVDTLKVDKLAHHIIKTQKFIDKKFCELYSMNPYS